MENKSIIILINKVIDEEFINEQRSENLFFRCHKIVSPFIIMMLILNNNFNELK